MRRNETNTAVAFGNTSSIALTEEQEKEFVKAMKIGYYKTFFKQGLITAEQLEKLTHESLSDLLLSRAMALYNDILLDRQKLSGNIFAEVKPGGPLKERLVWHTELGYDLGWSDAERYEPMVSMGTYTRNQNMASRQKNANKYR